MGKEQGKILLPSYHKEVESPLCSEILHALHAVKARIKENLTFDNFCKWYHEAREYCSLHPVYETGYASSVITHWA